MGWEIVKVLPVDWDSSYLYLYRTVELDCISKVCRSWVDLSWEI